MKRVLIAVILVVVAVSAAYAIETLSRYKTFGREILTAANLNEMQDEYIGKINEIIAATADSNYVYLRADTLVVANYMTSGGTVVSVAGHIHGDIYYTEAETDALLNAKAASSHAHAGTDLTSATGTGNPVLATSPDLGGTPTVGSGNTIWHKGNDGASSLLDADLLDGQEGAYYAADGATGQVQVYDSDGTFDGDANLVFSSGKLKVGGTPTGPSEFQVESADVADILLSSAAGNDIQISFYEASDARAILGVDASTSSDLIFLNPDGAAANGIFMDQSGRVGIESSPDGTRSLAVGAGGLLVSGAIEVGAVTAGAVTSSGLVTGTGLTVGTAVLVESELETIDDVVGGFVTASKALVVDANKDLTTSSWLRNVTMTGELEAGTLDISGDIDIDGTANLDATTVDGTLTATALDISGAIDVDGATNLDATTVDGILTASALVVSGDIDIDGVTNLDATTVDGTVTATALDISGDIDIDGTANLDATDIDGMLTLDANGVTFSDASVQTEAYDRLTGNNGYNAPASGTRTVSNNFDNADINRAFTKSQAIVCYDHETDDDETLWTTFVDNGGSFRFYHDKIYGSSETNLGDVLSMNQYGVSVKVNNYATSSRAFYLEGNGEYSGTWTSASDDRYKEQTQSLTGAVDKIKTLDAFSYEWKTDSPVGMVWTNRDSTDKATYLGVSAQELKAVYPDLVKGSDADGYSVDYSRLTVVLLAAIQELEARVSALEAQ